MIYEPELVNPYMSYSIEFLQNEIVELTCEEQDHEYRHDFEHADQARHHRNLATQAIIAIAQWG